MSLLLHLATLFTVQTLRSAPSAATAADGIALPNSTSCPDKCGTIPLNYPFGAGTGCGHPDFSRFVKCSGRVLQLSTATGIYAVSSVEYATSTLLLADPLMSTCRSMQNSGSFALDAGSPFEIAASDVFVLLGCSTSSPVFDDRVEMCDAGSSHVCKGLYSCEGVRGIGLEPNGPVSTCCAYDPPRGAGSGYVLDLPKLQCASYTSVLGFGEDEGDPARWDYGIGLRYNDSYQTEGCKACETSAGTCGYSGLDNSFRCVCRNGINTSSNCYGQGYAWSGSWRQSDNRRIRILGNQPILAISFSLCVNSICDEHII